MLINLSNHPLNTWPKAQSEEALSKFGEILDIPFPNIEPDWDEEKIAQLADQISSNIIHHHGHEIAAVHVMGEFTLTYALVQRFKEKGYTCVASTSERIVEMLPDGSKNVKFEFCRFRRYE